MKHLEHLRGMYEEIDGTSLGVERILEQEGKAEAVEWLKKIERKKKRGGRKLMKEGCAKCEIQVATNEIYFKVVLRNKGAL